MLANYEEHGFKITANVGVGGKTKDVKSFVFDTLKLPAAAWSDKTKDPKGTYQN